ncbi:hypothetical protein V6N11_015308 [Hibiscus sabdariffa]|uniref:Uncharacterized protein n=1 Tax=Hibiscus sabdariffa TaxID=183260 RepID=A0ABR2TRY1_9ROSI
MHEPLHKSMESANGYVVARNVIGEGSSFPQRLPIFLHWSLRRILKRLLPPLQLLCCISRLFETNAFLHQVERVNKGTSPRSE